MPWYVQCHGMCGALVCAVRWNVQCGGMCDTVSSLTPAALAPFPQSFDARVSSSESCLC